MYKPENKKKSAHYFLEKKKSFGNKQIYVYFRVILPVLIPDEIRYLFFK